MRNDESNDPKLRRLGRELGGLQLDTPPVDTQDIQGLVEGNLDASVYSEKLASQWRSLLDESSGLETVSEGSLLFRPRAGIGLEPVDAPGLPTARPGDVLDDFELLRLVAQGGMGQVWEARQRRLDRLVALKLIRPDRMTPEALAFFEREGRAAGRLRHASIVTVYAMGESDDVHWIAQEYVDGECTLADFLGDVDAAKKLPRDYDRRIALFFFQLADGLAYAHEQNVTHRDLKPQNVMIAEGDRPKLTDFGLARLEEETALEGGGLLGTPRYMSPEQAQGQGDNFGRPSDIFSLGTMLYQALTLRLPFDGENLTEILHAVSERDPIPCRGHRASIPPDLAAIVWKAMRKDPANRYAAMGGMAADLGAFLDGRPVAARPVGLAQRARMLARRKPLALALSIGGAISAVVILTLARAWSGSALEARQERFDAKLFEAAIALDDHDEDKLATALDAMHAAIPGRPEGHLVRASWYVNSSEPNLAEGAIDAAIAAGYDPSSAREGVARDQFLLGVFHMAPGEPEGMAAARTKLRRAAELDPTLPGVWYPMYVLGCALDDSELALEALAGWESGLKVSDPRTRMVVAMRHLQRGEHEASVAEFRQIEAQGLAQELESFAFSRGYGQALLRSGRIHEATTVLERAVRHNDQDLAAWGNLGHCFYRKSLEAGLSDEARTELLLSAQAAAKRSLDLRWGKSFHACLQTLFLVEQNLNRLHGTNSTAALERLEELDPDDPVLNIYLASEHYATAREAFERGASAECLAALEESLQYSRQLFGPHVILGQHHGFDTSNEAGVALGAAHLDEAFELWANRDSKDAGAAKIIDDVDLTVANMVEAMLAARAYVAAYLDDAACFEETCRAMDEHLDRVGKFREVTELLTYAEALVIGKTPELRDAERAEELYESYLARAGIAPGEWPDAYDSTIKAILLGIEADKPK